MIKQKRFVDKHTEEFQVAKSAITSATADLFYEREVSELIGKRKSMSLNATLMYVSKGTYPEISFPVVYLASKYSKATGDDYGKAMRIAEYIMGCRSHTGGCIALECDTACLFMCVNSKQQLYL